MFKNFYVNKNKLFRDSKKCDAATGCSKAMSDRYDAWPCTGENCMILFCCQFTQYLYHLKTKFLREKLSRSEHSWPWSMAVGRLIGRSKKNAPTYLVRAWSTVIKCGRLWSAACGWSIGRSIDRCSAAGVAYYDYLRNGTFCFIMNEEDAYITTEQGFNLEMHPKYNKSSSHNKVKCETTK